jgi:hypothetical protein
VVQSNENAALGLRPRLKSQNRSFLKLTRRPALRDFVAVRRTLSPACEKRMTWVAAVVIHTTAETPLLAVRPRAVILDHMKIRQEIRPKIPPCISIFSSSS